MISSRSYRAAMAFACSLAGTAPPAWGTPESEWEQTIELLITKNTSGAKGDLVAHWNGPLTMIS